LELNISKTMYDNRNYLIIPTTEVSKVDFTQVCETSAETLRKSVAPAFVADLVGAEGPYTHSEILELLSGAEWSASMEEV